MKENKQLAGQVRLAMSLLPEDEMLGEIEASNNVAVERSWDHTSWPFAGIMEICITTYLEDGTRRKYLLLRIGGQAELSLMSEVPPFQ